MATDFGGLVSNDDAERHSAIARSAEVMEPQPQPLNSLPDKPLRDDWGWPPIEGAA